MSEHDANKLFAAEPGTGVQVEKPKPAPAAADGKLAGLMAGGDAGAGAKKSRGPDLEAEALRAAEAALAEGERAIASARAQLQEGPAASPSAVASRRPSRELALRMLLAVNVVAMVVVAALPSTHGDSQPTEQPPVIEAQPTSQITAPEYNEPFNRALAAADRRDYTTAVATLEQYLQDNSRMAPSRRLTVLTALSEYTARLGNFTRSQDFLRQANAIEQSHRTPEDLVADAKAAMANGDQDSLRRIWARFLLQQRQIPSWLYKHVAEAYLQLGDSYRLDADVAAEIARRDALEQAAQDLRNETMQPPEKGR